MTEQTDNLKIEKKINLEKRLAKIAGVVVGAGATALGFYNPELVPYIVVGGVGGVVGSIASDILGVGGVASGVASGVVGGVAGVVVGFGVASGAGVGVGVASGAGVGAGVVLQDLIKNPVNYIKNFITYGVGSGLLVAGGNYIGNKNSEIIGARVSETNDVNRIVVDRKNNITDLFEYNHNGTNVFLPKGEIERLERDKARQEFNTNLEERMKVYN